MSPKPAHSAWRADPPPPSPPTHREPASGGVVQLGGLLVRQQTGGAVSELQLHVRGHRVDDPHPGVHAHSDVRRKLLGRGGSMSEFTFQFLVTESKMVLGAN